MQKNVVNNLVEECSENIDGREMIYNGTLNEKLCNYCTIYITLLVIFFIIIISISSIISSIIQYLHECINFEIRIGGKLCRYVSLYHSPNQSQDDFESFANNLELNIDTATAHNSFLTVVLGDFNVKSNLWFKGDKTTYEGSEIDGITSTFGLQQIINEPTHIIGDSSSCIDLIFTSQQNLVMESGVHSSLHPNCHHQITYAKFSLKIYYPPPYEREIWHYEKANVDHIRRSVDEFSWERCFANISVNNKVHMFNKTIINRISSYITHETIICNDRDPPWINKDIKQLILDKNHAYKSYIRNDKSLQFFNQFQFLPTRLSSLIKESKSQYYTRSSQKLLDPKTSQKSYWSILKTFLNNKKIPCIPPLLHQDKFVADFKEKASIFNNFFANQYSIVSNNSKLPVTLTRKTHESLSKIDFLTDYILKIIRNLDPNKAHGHDMISIRMINICDTSICRPLKLIFQAFLESGKFPNEWKKANVVPVHKKSDKQILKNYRSISLLPIASKIFERLLYDRMSEFFIANNLIFEN